jgi:hypothetical protein
MQSSIEWLIEQMQNNIHHTIKIPSDYIEQAKSRHKQEIIDAYMDRMDVTNKEVLANIIGEEYYQKTFGKG